MPAITATLEYLQKLPKYEYEKPYWCFLPVNEDFDPDRQRVDNLEFEDHSDIPIQNLRDLKTDVKIAECGFEVLSHKSAYSSFARAEDVVQYRIETEELLKEKLDAVFVQCYDSRLRKNVPFQRRQLDLNDLTLPEGPARGVHNGQFPSIRDLMPVKSETDIRTRYHICFWPHSHQSVFIRGEQEAVYETRLPLSHRKVSKRIQNAT